VHAAGAAAISAKDQERAKLLHHKTVMKFSTVDRWGSNTLQPGHNIPKLQGHLG
jgi:hypothetical protein